MVVDDEVGTLEPVVAVVVVVVSTGGSVVTDGASGPAEMTFSSPATQAEARSANDRKIKAALRIRAILERGAGYSV